MTGCAPSCQHGLNAPRVACICGCAYAAHRKSGPCAGCDACEGWVAQPCATRHVIPDGQVCGCDAAPTLASVPLSDDQARELSRASKQVTSWTERRNGLIRGALAAGAGVREVARACGLNHATVININKPRGQR